LLGFFNNFPTSIHGNARYTYQTSTQQIQKAIVRALFQLNHETHELKTLTRSSPPHCEVNFEFGIAEEDGFNFLDKEELDKVLRILKEAKEPLRILDFFCASRYHTANANGKRKPLKFDYTLLRFTFYRRTMELFVAHERGTQRIPLEDLVNFLTNHINKDYTHDQQKLLTLWYLRAL